MSKHQSAWETIALRGIIGGNQSWVLKRELMWIPFFGWAIAIMEPIAINRKAGRKAVVQVIRQGSDYLARGNKVILFPEGTRTAPGTKGRYKLGGALLAEATGRPVVPVCHNAGVFWRRRDIRKYPGMIDVVDPVLDGEHRLVLDLPPALLVLRHLGGHTADSSIVDLPDEGVVFAGDLPYSSYGKVLKGKLKEQYVA